MRTVVMELLTSEFRRNCDLWYAALPDEKRAAVDAWLVANPLPPGAPAHDRVVYAYCEAPGTIDSWVLCRIAAADVTPEWLALRGPLVDTLPSGDRRSQFRESELREVPS